MTLDLLLALSAYAFVTSITPGPNNTMLLASSVNHGFRPTVPLMFGVNIGFSLLMLAVGFGIGSVFIAFPAFHAVLRYGGAVYLLYLAWRIAGSATACPDRTIRKPLGFFQAVAFQWVNPKAWIMAIGAFATYAPQNESGFIANVFSITVVFMLINAPCICIWAGFGMVLRGILGNPRYLRVFNVVMALLLVASLYPILASG